VIVATTVNATDDPIADLAASRGVPYYRGDEQDVLRRYAECAQTNNLDVIVRVTSDCPLIDGLVISDALADYLSLDDPRIYLSNTQQRTFPRGMDFEIMSSQALAEASVKATKHYQREHVTPYLYDGSDASVEVRHVVREDDLSRYRVTLDTAADFELLKDLIEDYDAATLDCDGIVAVLQQYPQLVALNQDVVQKTLT